MKKQLLTALLLVGVLFISFAQEKIKGSRNVTTESTEITPFTKISLDNDFEINLIQGEAPLITIEADDNLHEVITFEVTDSILKFKTLKDIRAHKKMAISVVFVEGLSTIELKDKAEITNTEVLQLDNLTLDLKGSSRAYLTLKCNEFIINNNEKAKAELNIETDFADLNLTDSSDLKALITANMVDADMLSRADAKIEGDSKEMKLVTDNNTKFIGENFSVEEALVLSDLNADIHIKATKELIIEAKGNSEIYIYDSPKITLSKFEDNAVLRKK